MSIYFEETSVLIETGITKLKEYFSNDEWPVAIKQCDIIGDATKGSGDRRIACFRVIEDIEYVRYCCTNPDDTMEAYLLAEHFREIIRRIH